MYRILAQDVAGIDECEFEKIGIFQSDVLVAPCYDLTMGIKSSAFDVTDGVAEHQQSLYISLNSDEVDYADLERAPKACGLYRYRGSARPNYVGEDFVEIRCDNKLGVLDLTAYFFALVRDCEFGVVLWGSSALHCDIPYLWKEGFIKGT